MRIAKRTLRLASQYAALDVGDSPDLSAAITFAKALLRANAELERGRPTTPRGDGKLAAQQLAADARGEIEG